MVVEMLSVVVQSITSVQFVMVFQENIAKLNISSV